MKCDQCEQEATVHELRVVGGKKVERHLCERCARKQGIAAQGQSAPVSPEMIQKYMQAMHQQAGPQQAAGGGGPKPATPAPLVKIDTCPSCGTGYLEFRQSGLLGCPECYKAFESQLGPLLERAHEGGTHHTGRLPKRAGGGAPNTAAPQIRVAPPPPSPAELRAKKVAQLKKQLDEAVKAEQYEQAAKLRDELRSLSEPVGGAPAAEKRKPS
jgi:protein arginine kinase activator